MENLNKTIQKEYNSLTLADFQNNGLEKSAKKYNMTLEQLLDIIEL